ncbi:SDR family oxidoreductase [Chitinophaga sp. Hz27]|uniref:SDR family oxidoreductase n=1 Tax=Chitinophaga sp. Hz27 TaxID=3347169 RepID=UPI0035D739D7
MSTVFITGAGQGLGHAFIEVYFSAGWHVIATCRDPLQVTALKSTYPGIDVYPLDVTDSNQLTDIAASLKGQPIELLINNAAWVIKESKLADITYQVWERAMHTNAFAWLKVTTALLESLQLATDSKVICISSQMGSITENVTGGKYIYRATKAAANMIAKNLAIELKPIRILVTAIHPGWLQTRLGGPQAPTTTIAGAAQIKQLVEKLTLEDTGKFLDTTGEIIEW